MPPEGEHPTPHARAPITADAARLLGFFRTLNVPICFMAFEPDESAPTGQERAPHSGQRAQADALSACAIDGDRAGVAFGNRGAGLDGEACPC